MRKLILMHVHVCVSNAVSLISRCEACTAAMPEDRSLQRALIINVDTKDGGTSVMDAHAVGDSSLRRSGLATRMHHREYERLAPIDPSRSNMLP